MLRDGRNEIVSQWTTNDGSNGDDVRSIDKELRRIAKRKCALDADQAVWLRKAEKLRVWRTLGFSNALEYLEDVFGYGPRTAVERIRVAKELGSLPRIERALASGEISYSAARELSRVASEQNEALWLARAKGKNLRDVEDMVAGHKKGDDPDDPTDPNLATREVTFKLPPEVYALHRQARAALEAERGGALDDVELYAVMCRRVLDAGEATAAKPSAPAYRITIRKCDGCKRAWHLAAGVPIEIGAAALAVAECDAQLLGDEDSSDPTRATGSIPPATRRKVWLRDDGRCRVPGCRAARHLDVHHIVHREHGGDHHPRKLLVLCSGHHNLLHAGLLSLTGHAPDQLTFMRDGKPLVDARAPREVAETAALRESSQTSRYDDVVRKTRAKHALGDLGVKGRAAGAAVDAVWDRFSPNSDLGDIVKAALIASNSEANQRGDDEESVNTLAAQALAQSGYKMALAKAAVDAARAHVGWNVDLATLIAEAFRRCGGT